MKKAVILIIMFILFLNGCASISDLHGSESKNENIIEISDDKAELNGKRIKAKRSDVFISNDIIYYEDKEYYESGNPYGEGDSKDMHTKEEAQAHTVLNITKSGTYRIKGTLSAGQIRVDLGKDASKSPDAAVKLILDGADITCRVAPAILFMNVHECDGNWSEETASPNVDTSKAGAVLVLADGSENNISGSYVEKIFKDNEDEEKLWKQDGAIYSYMSMNIEGDGTLNVNAENEGIDTEMHLTINGGNINICSQNDGINTNEDNVSVTTINGGNINIIAGLGDEGDGIDSNGWLVINGGNVTSSANPISDAGLDSDLGSFINGGTVVALGSTMDWAESDSNQVTMNLQFSQHQNYNSAIVVKDKEGNIVFAYKQPDINNKDINRDFRGAVISCANFDLKEEYMLYMGGTIVGEENNGVYIADSIKEYANGEKLGYYGTDLPRGPVKDGKPPKMPVGDERPSKPHGDTPPKTPHDEGWRMPFEENHDGPEQKNIFVMTDKVNLFSGVEQVE